MKRSCYDRLPNHNRSKTSSAFWETVSYLALCNIGSLLCLSEIDAVRGAQVTL